MGIWEKIKELFSSIFPDNLKLSSSKNIKLRISGKGKHKVNLDKSTKIYNVTINVLSLTDASQKELVQEVLKEYVHGNGGQPLIADETSEGIKDFLLTEESTDVNKIINSIKEFIPEEDIRIIRAANHVNRKFKERVGSVDRLKEDIGFRWGQRGRDITNLLTAGYFENYIVPVLTGKVETPFPKLSRAKFYEIVVNEKAFSVFVPKGITDEELKTKIINQSIRNVEEYSRNYVNIHALGVINVRKVKNVIKELAETEQFYNFVLYSHINKNNKVFIQLFFGDL